MKFLKSGLLALATFGFSSISFSQAPTASGNVMNFSSVASYETYTNDENSWSSLHNIAAQSSTLTTLAEQAETDVIDTLYPEFLREVLNIDNIFQIGNYLIKIDLPNDRGLVVATDNANAYSDLVTNNLTAPGIMQLTGDEDLGLELLEALANGSTNSVDYQSFLQAERPCPGASRRKKADNHIWGNDLSQDCPPTGTRVYFMDNKIVYQKAIFYFSLQSKVISKRQCIEGGNTQRYNEVDLNLQGTAKYRKRCAPESNQSADIHESYYSGNTDAETNWRPYTGGRSLSHYDFTVRFGIRNMTDRNPNPPPYNYSPYYNIKSGY